MINFPKTITVKNFIAPLFFCFFIYQKHKPRKNLKVSPVKQQVPSYIADFLYRLLVSNIRRDLLTFSIAFLSDSHSKIIFLESMPAILEKRSSSVQSNSAEYFTIPIYDFRSLKELLS